MIDIMMDLINLHAGAAGITVNSPRNYAQDLYRTIISLKAATITEEMMNAQICPYCGIFPHVTCSDGNVKNAINLGKPSISHTMKNHHLLYFTLFMLFFC